MKRLTGINMHRYISICVVAYIDIFLPVCICVHITVKFITYKYIYQLVTCAAITNTKQAQIEGE